MARFLKNGPCNQCGSRDNRAHYDDGSEWCWGCHFYVRPCLSPLVLEARKAHGPVHGPTLPQPDLILDFSKSALNWLNKYDIPVPYLLENGVRYSEDRDQVVFTFPAETFYQARNLSPSSKVRYFTSGSHEDFLPIYPFTRPVEETSTDGAPLVLVEDCLSAIKVSLSTGGFPDPSGMALNGPVVHAMSLFGTHLTTEKLNRLKRLYSDVIVWLDRDAYPKALKIAQRCRMVGIGAKVVITDKDPKELVPTVIREKCKDS